MAKANGTPWQCGLGVSVLRAMPPSSGGYGPTGSTGGRLKRQSACRKFAAAKWTSVVWGSLSGK